MKRDFWPEKLKGLAEASVFSSIAEAQDFVFVHEEIDLPWNLLKISLATKYAQGVI
jgi:hypothetical protein